MEPAKSSSSIFETLSRFSRRGSMFDTARSSIMGSSVSFSSSANNSSAELYKKPKKRKNYENTYRLGPDETPKLGELQDQLQKLLDASCLDVDYSLIDSARFSKSVTQSIHKQLVDLIPPRYRFTLQTFVIENGQQDVAIGSKWLWNTGTDTSLTVRHENQTMTSVVVLHLVYFE